MKEQNAPGNKRPGIRKPGVRNIIIGGETLAEACRRANVPYGSVLNRIRQQKCTPREALAHVKRLHLAGLFRDGCIVVDGLKLETLCKKAGVGYGSAYWRIRNLNESPEQAIEHLKRLRHLL